MDIDKYKISEKTEHLLLFISLILLIIANILIFIFNKDGEFTMIEISTSFWVLIIAVIFVVIIAITYIYAYLFAKIIEILKENKFKKDFNKIIIQSQPSWSDIKEIVKEYDLDKFGLIRVVRKSYIYILTGEVKELSKYKNIVEDYIKQYKKEEPFENIPSDISTHLIQIIKNNNENKQSVDFLATEIKKLLDINSRKMKLQRLYTISSLGIGVIGAALAIYINL